MIDPIFLDTNVVIDLLGEREPFYESAARLATLAEKKHLQMSVSALTWPTVFYILSRYESGDSVRKKITLFKSIITTIDLTDRDINLGLASTFRDFEDALQYYGALQAGCSVFITRNVKDYASSELPVLTPDEYISGRVALHR
ncbi:MAG: PIN domain-containing protein [Balneolales bacterium]|nr:PIN domain-containing protein [Balneolales bacterium]